MAFKKRLNPIGGEKYEGHSTNRPTLKQLKLIEIIESRLPEKFEGTTSREAYNFIQLHYREV